MVARPPTEGVAFGELARPTTVAVARRPQQDEQQAKEGEQQAAGGEQAIDYNYWYYYYYCYYCYYCYY